MDTDRLAKAPLEEAQSRDEPAGGVAKSDSHGRFPTRLPAVGAGLAAIVLVAIGVVYRPRIAIGTFFVGVSGVLACTVLRGESKGRRLRFAYSVLFFVVSLHYFGVVRLV